MGVARYLLDTHTFLWSVRESRRLSVTANAVLTSVNSKCFVSAVSAYEIMNKYRIGKLPEYAYVAENYLEVLRQFGAKELPIKGRHAYDAGRLDWSHRDPFDRLLAAQAISENMILITDDSVFQLLPQLSVLW